MDWTEVSVDDYIIIDCYSNIRSKFIFSSLERFVPSNNMLRFSQKQWGQNLIKFQGVKLPGGVELNGRQIYDDGERIEGTHG